MISHMLLWLLLAAPPDDATIVATPVEAAPEGAKQLYADGDYEFVTVNYGNGDRKPGLFVNSRKTGRWVRIEKIATAGGTFGSSLSDKPEERSILDKVSVSWDFRKLADEKYAPIPLHTSGSIAFPDHVVSYCRTNRYRLDFFSQYKIDSARTTLFISKDDLLQATAKP